MIYSGFVGTLVLDYLGERITVAESKKRERLRDDHSTVYGYAVLDGVVDARDEGNAGRFVNHSCEVRCFFVFGLLKLEFSFGVVFISFMWSSACSNDL